MVGNERQIHQSLQQVPAEVLQVPAVLQVPWMVRVRGAKLMAISKVWDPNFRHKSVASAEPALHVGPGKVEVACRRLLADWQWANFLPPLR